MDIKSGDVPETDQELDKILAKQSKPGKRTPVARKQKALVLDVAPVVEEKEIPVPISTAIPQERLQELAKEFNSSDMTALDQQLKTAKRAYKKSRGATISPGEADRIAQEKGYDEDGKSIKPARKPKAVVLDGNQEVVTDPKLAKALVQSEQRKQKKVAQLAHDPTQSHTSKNGRVYKPKDQWKKPVKVTQEKVDTMLRMKTEGATHPEIAEVTGVHTGMVGWVLTGKGHQDKSHLQFKDSAEAKAYWQKRQAKYQAQTKKEGGN